TPTITNSTIGIATSLIATGSSVAAAVDGYHEANLGASADGALRRDRTIMGQHRLARYRQPKSRTAGLRRDIGIPDSRELIVWNAAARVRHRDLHRIVAIGRSAPVPHAAIPAANVHRDPSTRDAAAGVDGIQHDVRQRASEC